MPPAGFESSIPASERPQTHVLDRAATVRLLEMFVRQLCTEVQIRRTKVEDSLHMANDQRQFHRKYRKYRPLLRYFLLEIVYSTTQSTREKSQTGLRVGTIRMHESFASSPRKYVWAKPAKKQRKEKKRKEKKRKEKKKTL